MPLYVYRCIHCRTEITLIRQVADRDDLPVCRCGRPAERQVTAAELRFRGDGWQTPRAGERGEA